uniref:SLC12A transporter C-terminal domain-containing protein n=1 Tax=Parascaris equorum TaxID=6256 RepID=A0A914R740_PAREQ
MEGRKQWDEEDDTFKSTVLHKNGCKAPIFLLILKLILKLIGAVANDECIMVTKGITDFPQSTSRLTGFIDIWWMLHDGGILMLIAFLLRQHKRHRKARRSKKLCMLKRISHTIFLLVAFY